MKKQFVYIYQFADGLAYIGKTDNLALRDYKHRKGNGASADLTAKLREQPDVQPQVLSEHSTSKQAFLAMAKAKADYRAQAKLLNGKRGRPQGAKARLSKPKLLPPSKRGPDYYATLRRSGSKRMSASSAVK